MFTYPQFAEEVGRKALDVMAASAMKLDEGSITERELWLIADAVYDTISGLASREDQNIVYAVRQGVQP